MERKILEYLLAGESLRWIVRKLGAGDRRVRRARERAEECGYLSGQVPLPPYPEAVFSDPIDGRSERENANDVLLLSKKDWLTERLTAGWRPITVFEEMGVAVSRSSFYRFLHRQQLYSVGKNYRRVVPEIIHTPGVVEGRLQFLDVEFFHLPHLDRHGFFLRLVLGGVPLVEVRGIHFGQN